MNYNVSPQGSNKGTYSSVCEWNTAVPPLYRGCYQKNELDKTSWWAGNATMLIKDGDMTLLSFFQACKLKALASGATGFAMMNSRCKIINTIRIGTGITH